MPICDDNRVNSKIDYKQKYIHLKRKLKLLIYENEYYTEELNKAERQLLQVSRDKSYLLDRLLQYEKIESSTSDSDNTESSDSEIELKKMDTKKKKIESVSNDSPINTSSSRKKKTNTQPSSSRSRSSSTGKPSKSQSMAIQVDHPMTSASISTATTPLFKNEITSTITSSMMTPMLSSKTSVNSTIDGHMTSEELERHLESRRQPSAMLMPEKTPLTVPVELFSNESSNGLPDDDHMSLRLIQ
ncbi:INO80 complex subunit E-like [Oppia nitens]|uniref:INO80 complex subunit E-like n=1 Tax=Oppia nitens TaxID=1686743 RepID=UPI0023DC8590|nr:INO80 complex subunit E-like [Oppia nitens]